MTIYMLGDDIVERLKGIFAGFYPEGIDRPVNIYRQNAPQAQKKDDDSIYPFCIVQLGDGQDDDEHSFQNVAITIGVKDTDKDFRGYRSICSMIERIRLDFLENPTVNNRYELIRPLKWSPEIGDKKFPYYFGGIILKFGIPEISTIYNI